MPLLLDVVVPDGVGAGGVVSFEDESGRVLEAVVPEGLASGETFKVEVGDDGGVHPLEQLSNYMEERAAGGDLTDKFVAWFERESVGDQIDAFIERNAHLIGAIPSVVDGEQSHEWWALYQEYQAQFDALLQQFLDDAGCTAHDFLSAAEKAEGMNEMYFQLFLAHSDYQVFVDLMATEAQKQRAASELQAGQ